MIGFRLTVPFPYTTACYTIAAAYDKSCEKPLTQIAYRGGMATKEKIKDSN